MEHSLVMRERAPRERLRLLRHGIGVCPPAALKFKSEHDLRTRGEWRPEEQTTTDKICGPLRRRLHPQPPCPRRPHRQNNLPARRFGTRDDFCIKGRFGWQAALGALPKRAIEYGGIRTAHWRRPTSLRARCPAASKLPPMQRGGASMAHGSAGASLDRKTKHINARAVGSLTRVRMPTSNFGTRVGPREIPRSVLYRHLHHVAEQWSRRESNPGHSNSVAQRFRSIAQYRYEIIR